MSRQFTYIASAPLHSRIPLRPLSPLIGLRVQSVDEWTGIRMSRDSDVPESIEPVEMHLLGNYAVQISWPDGFSQVAPLDQLEALHAAAGPDGKAVAGAAPAAAAGGAKR